jgi:Na+(H+)/acetate symporter ActP
LPDGIRLSRRRWSIAIVTQVPVTFVVIVLGAAMIVYTMRGGVSAVIWTDVVQMFVTSPARAVAIALLAPHRWRLGRGVRAGSETGRFRVARHGV